mmetsp:Transcript_16965/g.44875  ORF Transcript_16965/g.44875 Transcript_16965/m.44875 type:complete len:220 (-) Transcript_16965:91-750(-)
MRPRARAALHEGCCCPQRAISCIDSSRSVVDALSAACKTSQTDCSQSLASSKSSSSSNWKSIAIPRVDSAERTFRPHRVRKSDALATSLENSTQSRRARSLNRTTLVAFIVSEYMLASNGRAANSKNTVPPRVHLLTCCVCASLRKKRCNASRTEAGSAVQWTLCSPGRTPRCSCGAVSTMGSGTCALAARPSAREPLPVQSQSIAPSRSEPLISNDIA